MLFLFGPDVPSPSTPDPVPDSTKSAGPNTNGDTNGGLVVSKEAKEMNGTYNTPGSLSVACRQSNLGLLLCPVVFSYFLFA